MRIVSLVPSHTESLHDLGAADLVVGRTRFCIHPEAWVSGLPIVGGTKDAKAGKVLALEPDLVVADKDENPLRLVEDLQAAGVEVLWSEIDTVEDAAAFLETLGARIGRADQGREASAAIRKELASVGGPRVPVWCPIWYRPWMTFDATAYPHAMLEAVGLHNVFGAHRGPKYFEVGDQDVQASGARWTLLPTEPFPFHQQRETLDLAALGPLGQEERVRIIDGEALTWFGTRTVAGLEVLAQTAQALREADAHGEDEAGGT